MQEAASKTLETVLSVMLSRKLKPSPYRIQACMPAQISHQAIKINKNLFCENGMAAKAYWFKLIAKNAKHCHPVYNRLCCAPSPQTGRHCRPPVYDCIS